MARRRAMQAIYQWQQSGCGLRDVETEFLADQDMSRTDVPYFQALLRGVDENLEAIDADLGPLLDRRVKEVDPVERAILRIGAFEFRYRLDIPFRVVLNEAIELAKVYGADQSHRYVNGVLDKLGQQLRQTGQ
jgi:N utilization substance protein B